MFAPMSARRSKVQRDYARRGVYIDYLGRFVWSCDSLGHETPPRMIASEDDGLAIAQELEAELDRTDPIPSAAFVRAPLPRHLRLL